MTVKMFSNINVYQESEERGVVVPAVAPAGCHNQQVKSELIRIAGVLVQCHYIPSGLVDDYPQKTYSAGRVARMMEKAHEQSKSLAIQVRNLADSIKS